MQDRDLRPHRVKKPKTWLVIVGLLFTPGCLGIPVVGWAVAIIGWYMTIKQYLQAVRDEKYPAGHFYGE